MTSNARVRDYVAGQTEHHRVETFQDEYRRFLSEHGIAFDERYMWHLIALSGPICSIAYRSQAIGLGYR